MQGAIADTQGLTREEFEADTILRLATSHRLLIIGEAASKLTPEFRAALPLIPWKQIIGMRNLLVQQYWDVEPHILWDTVTNDLPALLRLLPQIDDSDD